jgi:rfaE bifunctional protein kinase chain/domain
MSLLEKFKSSIANKKLLLVGDAMVDIEVRAKETSGYNEFGSAILQEISRKRYAGGAANLALNCRGLGAEVVLFSPIGLDQEGEWLVEELESHGITYPWASSLWRKVWKGTTTKTRILNGSKAFARLDRDRFLTLYYAKELTKMLEVYAPYDAVLFSDYQKGALEKADTVAWLVHSIREHSPNVVIAANPKPEICGDQLAGLSLDLVQLNEKECQEITEREVGAWAAQRKLGCRYLLHTKGRQGLSLIDEHGDLSEEKALPVACHSIVGAGDSVFAAASLAILGGMKRDDIAKIANAAGAARVQLTNRQHITLQDLKPLLDNSDLIETYRDACCQEDA